MPLLLHHGWPWTFWDVRKVIGPLTDPAAHGGDPADSFDVVLISLPGYGFSSPLTETGWNWWHTADLENALMKDVLGYEQYATAGGDWGALVAQQHGHKYEQDVYRRLHPLPRADEPLPAGAPGRAARREVRPGPRACRTRANTATSEKGWFERGQALRGERERLRRDPADQAADAGRAGGRLPGGPARVDHREALLLGPGGARGRHRGVRAGLAEGGPRDDRRGLLPDQHRRHVVALLLGVPRQPVDSPRTTGSRWSARRPR